MKLVLLLALSVCLVSSLPAYKVGARSFDSKDDALFAKFKQQFGKVYFDDHDESYRKAIFLANLVKVNKHNEEQKQEKHTFTMAMNEFGDLTWEEFHSKYTGFMGQRARYVRTQNTEDLSHVEAPSSIDWVSQGAVTDVKNQAQCGSCWAFSSTGSIEGAHYLSTGNLVSLSEQQLMDCSTDEGNEACNGGLMDNAFEYVIQNQGICSEASYPYEAKTRTTCKSCTPVATISSYKDVDQSESALKNALAKQPVSIAIEADQTSFQFYSSGVLTEECGHKLDHGVLAVGYGTMDGTDYWKVKNSWGSSWGMDGYILLERGINAQTGGQCGILLSASYPKV